jgi:hypothetical protein
LLPSLEWLEGLSKKNFDLSFLNILRGAFHLKEKKTFTDRKGPSEKNAGTYVKKRLTRFAAAESVFENDF